MRERTAALLIIAAGAGVVALSATAQQQRFSAARAPQPSPGQSAPLAIDWGAANKQSQSGVNERGRAVNGKFIAANKAAIDKVAIPVLLPGDPDLSANLRIFPNGPYYTVSSRTVGMAFTLTGAGRAYGLSPETARGLPNGQLKSRIPADGIVIETTETGIDASFSRFGAAYSISLECAAKALDPRCKDSAYVRGVIGRLMVVAPGGAS